MSQENTHIYYSKIYHCSDVCTKFNKGCLPCLCATAHSFVGMCTSSTIGDTWQVNVHLVDYINKIGTNYLYQSFLLNHCLLHRGGLAVIPRGIHLVTGREIMSYLPLYRSLDDSDRNVCKQTRLGVHETSTSSSPNLCNNVEICEV